MAKEISYDMRFAQIAESFSGPVDSDSRETTRVILLKMMGLATREEDVEAQPVRKPILSQLREAFQPTEKPHQALWQLYLSLDDQSKRLKLITTCLRLAENLASIKADQASSTIPNFKKQEQRNTKVKSKLHHELEAFFQLAITEVKDGNHESEVALEELVLILLTESIQDNPIADKLLSHYQQKSRKIAAMVSPFIQMENNGHKLRYIEHYHIGRLDEAIQASRQRLAEDQTGRSAVVDSLVATYANNEEYLTKCLRMSTTPSQEPVRAQERLEAVRTHCYRLVEAIGKTDYPQENQEALMTIGGELTAGFLVRKDARGWDLAIEQGSHDSFIDGLCTTITRDASLDLDFLKDVADYLPTGSEFASEELKTLVESLLTYVKESREKYPQTHSTVTQAGFAFRFTTDIYASPSQTALDLVVHLYRGYLRSTANMQYENSRFRADINEQYRDHELGSLLLTEMLTSDSGFTIQDYLYIKGKLFPKSAELPSRFIKQEVAGLLSVGVMTPELGEHLADRFLLSHPFKKECIAQLSKETDDKKLSLLFFDSSGNLNSALLRTFAYDTEGCKLLLALPPESKLFAAIPRLDSAELMDLFFYIFRDAESKFNSVSEELAFLAKVFPPTESSRLKLLLDTLRTGNQASRYWEISFRLFQHSLNIDQSDSALNILFGNDNLQLSSRIIYDICSGYPYQDWAVPVAHRAEIGSALIIASENGLQIHSTLLNSEKVATVLFPIIQEGVSELFETRRNINIVLPYLQSLRVVGLIDPFGATANQQVKKEAKQTLLSIFNTENSAYPLSYMFNHADQSLVTKLTSSEIVQSATVDYILDRIAQITDDSPGFSYVIWSLLPFRLLGKDYLEIVRLALSEDDQVSERQEHLKEIDKLIR